MAAWTYHKTVCGGSYTLWIAILQCENIHYIGQEAIIHISCNYSL